MNTRQQHRQAVKRVAAHLRAMGATVTTKYDRPRRPVFGTRRDVIRSEAEIRPGVWRISDAAAAGVASNVGGRLPRPGYQLRVQTHSGDGHSLMWLRRLRDPATPRGWSWVLLGKSPAWEEPGWGPQYYVGVAVGGAVPTDEAARKFRQRHRR